MIKTDEYLWLLTNHDSLSPEVVKYNTPGLHVQTFVRTVMMHPKLQFWHKLYTENLLILQPANRHNVPLYKKLETPPSLPCGQPYHHLLRQQGSTSHIYSIQLKSHKQTPISALTRFAPLALDLAPHQLQLPDPPMDASVSCTDRFGCIAKCVNVSLNEPYVEMQRMAYLTCWKYYAIKSLWGCGGQPIAPMWSAPRLYMALHCQPSLHNASHGTKQSVANDQF